MAKLPTPNTNHQAFADQLPDILPAAGTFVATILDIRDEFGVMRPKFQSSELEKVDQTAFLFGYRDAGGNPHKIATQKMRISGNENSNLFITLKQILGRAPELGWDYCSLVGKKCLLTVELIRKNETGRVYAKIAALSPLPEGLVPATQPTSGPSAGSPLSSGIAAPKPPAAAQPVPVTLTEGIQIPF